MSNSSGVTVHTNGALAYRHWPPGVPVETSPDTLVRAARDWLLGEDNARIAVLLKVDASKMWGITNSPQWSWLASNFRDEYVATQGGKYQRLENKFLTKLEEYADDGLTVFYTDKEGQPRSYQRELTPKEVISATLMLNEQNKRIDRLAGGDADKNKFNQQATLKRLEKLAQKLESKEIEGEAIRDPAG